jgi:23S rRNA (cytosine1962-C5)-methyltransferase
LYKKVTIKPQREASLQRFHPWIFSGSIHSVEKGTKNGDAVILINVKGEKLAVGHYFEGSIAVRVLSFDGDQTIEDILKDKLERAYNYRRQLGLVDNPNTNLYRLIHAEGDGLPGLIIDIYGRTAVIQCHTVGMYQHLICIEEVLVGLYGSEINIFDKSSDLIQEAKEKNYIRGSYQRENWVENGYQFDIDWEKGQKTGFFIDQRNNRKALQAYCRGKKVMNLFSYSGGFSIYAQAAGAAKVVSVDASASANEICKRNFKLNFNTEHEAITADALDYMKDMSQEFDVIILDPPAFAKHLSAKHKAIQAYKRINLQAMRHIQKGGILFTFSCSQVIDALTFRDTVVAAGIESGRTIRIVQQLSQPEDHPINLFHPESNYLKGLVLYVE